MRIGFFSTQVAFDIGSKNTYLASSTGFFGSEATFLLKDEDGKYIFGNKAELYAGKIPMEMSAIKPVKNDAVQDYDALVTYVRMFLRKALGTSFSSFEAIMTLPPNATGVQKIAEIEAVKQVGAKNVYVALRPVMIRDALGVDKAAPVMIVDMGEDNFSISVVQGGKVLINRVLNFAGNNMRKSVIDFARANYGIVIGEAQAEMIKNKLASAMPEADAAAGDKIIGMTVDTKTRAEFLVTMRDLYAALKDYYFRLSKEILDVFKLLDRNVAALLKNQAVYLVGGSSNIRYLPDFLSINTGANVMQVRDIKSLTCRAALKVFNNKEALKRYKNIRTDWGYIN